LARLLDLDLSGVVTYRLVGTKGVVVGRVIKIRLHVRGERIWLADVDIGAEYQLQIVWGGLPIVKGGHLVPVAPPGARLPDGKKMRRRRYRGEISEGMLCSPAELGWDPSVTDRVALLDDSIGLSPGESLDNRDNWQSIVIPAAKPPIMDLPCLITSFPCKHLIMRQTSPSPQAMAIYRELARGEDASPAVNAACGDYTDVRNAIFSDGPRALQSRAVRLGITVSA
jgi:tRNA-binding EMAP/Myf-like protein